MPGLFVKDIVLVTYAYIILYAASRSVRGEGDIFVCVCVFVCSQKML